MDQTNTYVSPIQPTTLSRQGVASVGRSTISVVRQELAEVRQLVEQVLEFVQACAEDSEDEDVENEVVVSG
jgi:hypothetical protein